MDENEIAKVAVDCAFRVHTTLGPGLLESVYEIALAHEILNRGLIICRQVPIPVRYGEVRFDAGFIADMIVGDKLIIELKSIEQIAPVHKKQLLTYLRLSGKRLGLLMNFGQERIKDGIIRVANGMPETLPKNFSL